MSEKRMVKVEFVGKLTRKVVAEDKTAKGAFYELQDAMPDVPKLRWNELGRGSVGSSARAVFQGAKKKSTSTKYSFVVTGPPDQIEEFRKLWYSWIGDDVVMSEARLRRLVRSML